MGSIHPGDEGMHYSDWSHRWCGGPIDEAGSRAWQAALREHMEEHRLGAEMRRPRKDSSGPRSPS